VENELTVYDLRAALDRAVKVTLGNTRKPWEFTRAEYVAHVKEVTGLQLLRKAAAARLKEAVDRGELKTRAKVRDKGKTVRVWSLPDAERT